MVSFGFVVYVFLSLKAVEPIDLHYMTERLQRFELEVLCSTEETKSNTSRMPCRGYADKQHIYILGELSL